jgi:glucan biosynthesis protein C
LNRSLNEKALHPPHTHDLDWVRLLAVLLLIAYHSAAVFFKAELSEFDVVNAATSDARNVLIQFVQQWPLPLFFFPAGAAGWFPPADSLPGRVSAATPSTA